MRILSPEGSVGTRAVSLAPSPPVLAGQRVAVLDNGKPGAARLMEALAGRLAERTGAVIAGTHRKRTAATPCEDALLGEITETADLVVTGTAD